VSAPRDSHEFEANNMYSWIRIYVTHGEAAHPLVVRLSCRI
jgi:hypothetical protein